MTPGTGQWPSFTGLGGQAHLAPAVRSAMARYIVSACWLILRFAVARALFAVTFRDYWKSDRSRRYEAVAERLSEDWQRIDQARRDQAWDRFGHAVADGSAAEIRSAREHLTEVTR